MTDRPKMDAAPLIYVLLADGSEFDVQPWNPDMLAWDRGRARHKWPDPGEAPWVWLTFLAWHTLTREETIPKITLADFEASTRVVTPYPPEDGEDVPAVDPTPPDLEPG